MLLKPTNNSLAEIDPALDQSQLFALGLDDVRRFSRQLWTDHNTHDPGITILELLCYALTDLSYRAQFPLEDLLATPTDNAQNMAAQFFTAREILPNRPLTVADYRKLLIDLPEVRNAWISPHPLRYFTDTIHKRLWRDDPGTFGIRPVNSHGVYDIRLEFMDEVTTPEKRQAVIAGAMRVLQANRNLCEDFVSIPSAATAKRRAIIPSSTISRRSTASPMRVCLRKRMPCSANARASRTRTTATPIKKSVSCYGHRPPGLWVAACRGERRRRDQGQPGRRQCATEVRAPLHGAPLRRELQQGPRPYGRPRRQTQSPSQRPRVHRRQSGLFRRRPVPAGKPGRAGAHCPRINAHDSAGRGRAT